MGEEVEVIPGKRYNVFLKYPVAGFGEPGQRGHFDMSAEDALKLMKRGAVERISEAAFSHPGVHGEQINWQGKLAKERRRRRR